MRFVFAAIALILVVTPTSYGNLTLMGFTPLTEYYLSGIILGTDKSTYICGDEIKASTALFSGNLTVANFPVSLQILSPSGKVLMIGSTLSDHYGVARFSLSLPLVCDIGIYTATATSQGKYNSVNSNAKFSVSHSGTFVTLKFDKIWYNQGDSVGLTGQLVTNCSLILTDYQSVELNVYAPDNGLLTSTSTRTTSPSFTFAFVLPASASSGLYEVVVYVLDPCQKEAILGNAFFSVLSNLLMQPWEISIVLDKSTYEVGDQILMSEIVMGGPYFFCQLGWACTGPIDVSIHVVNGNGTEIYSKTMNTGLGYYPPAYAFFEVFSGQVDHSYIMPGTYMVIAEVSNEGYPTVQATASFTVVSSLGDFSVSARPSMLSMIAPSSQSVELTIDPLKGFDSDVDLSVSWDGEEPTDVTITLYPAMNSSKSPWVSTLTISAGPAAPADKVYNLTVTGREVSNPNRSHSVKVQVQFTDFFMATATYGFLSLNGSLGDGFKLGDRGSGVCWERASSH